ncbi:MAG: cbb3-type cytochrome oxidase assembly protein CcoS [Pseudomonadota bacterium]
MNILVILVPCSLLLGCGALIGFVWTLKAQQYDDLEGDAARILLDDDAGA